MRRFAGSCRFVYNKGLALQKARFDAGEEVSDAIRSPAAGTRRSDSGAAQCSL
jgi:hypothetical protein